MPVESDLMKIRLHQTLPALFFFGLLSVSFLFWGAVSTAQKLEAGPPKIEEERMEEVDGEVGEELFGGGVVLVTGGFFLRVLLHATLYC